MLLRKWTIVSLVGILLLVGAVIAMDAPLFYSAKETRARIVDEKTGEPIEGAVVVARWALAVISGEQPSLHIAEAVTDKNGEFFIPGWGPKPRRPLTELREKSPYLSIFKHGYWPLELHNESIKRVIKAYPNYKKMSTKELRDATSWFQGAPDQRVQESMWNGLSIQLERFTGTPDRWLTTIDSLVITIPEEDERRVGHFFRALAAERNYFKEQPVSRQKQAALSGFFDRVDRALK